MGAVQSTRPTTNQSRGGGGEQASKHKAHSKRQRAIQLRGGGAPQSTTKAPASDAAKIEQLAKLEQISERSDPLASAGGAGFKPRRSLADNGRGVRCAESEPIEKGNNTAAPGRSAQSQLGDNKKNLPWRAVDGIKISKSRESDALEPLAGARGSSSSPSHCGRNTGAALRANRLPPLVSDMDNDAGTHAGLESRSSGNEAAFRDDQTWAADLSCRAEVDSELFEEDDEEDDSIGALTNDGSQRVASASGGRRSQSPLRGDLFKQCGKFARSAASPAASASKFCGTFAETSSERRLP